MGRLMVGKRTLARARVEAVDGREGLRLTFPLWQSGSCPLRLLLEDAAGNTLYDATFPVTVGPPLVVGEEVPRFGGRLYPGVREARVRVEVRAAVSGPDRLRLRSTLVQQDKTLWESEAEALAETQLTIPLEGLEPGPIEFNLCVLDARGRVRAQKQLAWRALREEDLKGRAALDEHGRLSLEGHPFFPVGVWLVQLTDVNLFKSWNLNTVFCMLPQLGKPLRGYLDEAQAAGLMVLPFFHAWYGLPAEKIAREDLSEYLSCAHHPALLAWNLIDDGLPEHLPAVGKLAALTREADPLHPLTGDVICAPSLWPEFRDSLDIMFQYGYPVPNYSFAEYAQLLDFWEAICGQPLFTWEQCFTWSGNNLRYGWGTTDTAGPLPDPAQLRLLTYIASARGQRGHLHNQFRPSRDGVRLEEENASLAAELRAVGEFLAAGEVIRDLPTSSPALKATAFRQGADTLVLCYVEGADYHRCVDEALLRDVTITAPTSSDRCKAFAIGWGGCEPLAVSRVGQGKLALSLGEVELTQLVLLTESEARAQEIASRVGGFLASTAPLVAEGARAEWQRLKDCCSKCGAGLAQGVPVQELLSESERSLSLADKSLADQDLKQAYLHSRAALRPLRRLVSEAMQFAIALSALRHLFDAARELHCLGHQPSQRSQRRS